MTSLSFPYYLYPGTPTSGYFDTDIYNNDLCCLHSELLNLNTSHETFLFHVTIGAPMEELFNICEKYKNIYDFQWQQLLPDHIIKALKNNIKVIHFIVSPNETFSPYDFKDPLFIQKTPDFDWELCGDREYISKKYNYTVRIFCTMMPTIDCNNKRQTDFDIYFVTNFYVDFRNTIKKIIKNNGECTCFSFAVFNMNTKNNIIQKYSMFEEIKEVYENSLLAEWIYYEYCYVLKTHENCKYHNDCDVISYVERSEQFDYGDNLMIDIKNGQINFYFIFD
jgi:hypothetical protein